MFSSRDAKQKIGAFAGLKDILLTGIKRIGITVFSLPTILLGSIFLPSIGNATLNVYLSTTATPSLQSTFMADATNQYEGILKPGLFYGSWSLTISSKKPSFPLPSPVVVTLDTIANKLITISSDTYLYGFANGMVRERADDYNLVIGALIADEELGTVGGVPLSSTQTYTVVVSTNPYIEQDMVLLSTTSAIQNSWNVYRKVFSLLKERADGVQQIP